MALTRPMAMFKIWLAALLAGLMLFGPIVSEAAAESAAEAACHADLAPHIESAPDAHAADPHGNGENSGVVRHHAHGCGGCHIHALVPVLFIPPAPGDVLRLPAFAGESPAPRVPSALFRPPRI